MAHSDVRVSCGPQQTSCNSCGKRLDEWEASNAGAYGGRCAGCNQLHKEGSYCPVCSKVSRFWLSADVLYCTW